MCALCIGRPYREPLTERVKADETEGSPEEGSMCLANGAQTEAICQSRPLMHHSMECRLHSAW